MTGKKNSPQKKKDEDELDDENSIDRASIFFDRARKLTLLSSGSSLELERQLRDVYKALSFGSDDIRHYMLLGKIYKLHLDLTSSMFCYRYVLNRDPSNIPARKFLVELLVLKGKELMFLGVQFQWRAKFVAARACFDESLEYNRENLSIWILKTICHVQCEELTEAFEAISKVIKPNRDLPAEVYILRAKIYWGRGLIEQGNQDIRIAASLDENHPEVLAYISRSYAKSEKLYKQALQLFQEARYKESLEIVDHALFITNEDIKLHILKSKLHRQLNMLQDAYDAIMKAKSIFESKYREEDKNKEYHLQLPPDIDQQINLIINEFALNYALEGNYQQAILLLNKIIRSEENLSLRMVGSPKSARKGSSGDSSVIVPTSAKRNPLTQAGYYVNMKYYMNRGDCYRALEDYPAAITDYQHALLLDANDWTVKTKLSLSHYLIATDYFNNSKFLLADIELTKAIEYNPKVSEYFSLRGKTRYYLADYQNSYFDYKECLVLNPENAEIQLRLQQYESNMTTPPASSQNPRDNKNANGGKTKSGKKKGSEGAISISIEAFGSGKPEKKMLESQTARQPRPPSPKKIADAPSSSSSPTSSAMIPLVRGPNMTRGQELIYQEQQRKFKLQQLLNLSRYTTDRKVMEIPVEEDDKILMMLNPQKASTLPPLKLLTNEMKEQEEEVKLKHQRKKILQPISIQTIHSVSLTHPSSVPNHPSNAAMGTGIAGTGSSNEFFTLQGGEYGPKHSASAPIQSVTLPEVLQKSNFKRAYIAAQQSAVKASKVKQEYEQRSDNNRGPMWNMVSAAHELAIQAAKPAHEQPSTHRKGSRKSSH